LTGGASGIGWASAQLLSSHGCKVVIGDRSPPPAGWESNKSLSFFKTDVTSWANQLDFFKQTLKLHGKIDIVCPNAGIAEGEMAFEDKTDEKTGDPIEPAWSTVNIDLIGTMITVKLALHFMRKTKEGGVIIMTGSRASECGSLICARASS
jgi:NAD(P)-dependent dehydrogenase (short-subunit alcohol dehydrogenase family)